MACDLYGSSTRSRAASTARSARSRVSAFHPPRTIAVSRDHDFGIAAARRREAAAQTRARGERRQSVRW